MRLTLLLAATLLLVLLAGCGTDPPTTTPAPSPTSAPAPTPTAVPPSPPPTAPPPTPMLGTYGQDQTLATWVLHVERRHVYNALSGPGMLQPVPATGRFWVIDVAVTNSAKTTAVLTQHLTWTLTDTQGSTYPDYSQTHPLETLLYLKQLGRRPWTTEVAPRAKIAGLVIADIAGDTWPVTLTATDQTNPAAQVHFDLEQTAQMEK